jgi:hypothetical protein
MLRLTRLGLFSLFLLVPTGRESSGHAMQSPRAADLVVRSRTPAPDEGIRLPRAVGSGAVTLSLFERRPGSAWGAPEPSGAAECSGAARQRDAASRQPRSAVLSRRVPWAHTTPPYRATPPPSRLSR